jgi:hypothetical protein
MKLTHEELLQVVKEELDAVIDEKKKKDCFKNKTFDGKVKCIQRTKGLSEKRASAYVASVLRDKGEIDENLIKEITRRKFCQLMGIAGGALATGCGSDYELLHNMVPNEAGEPPPECIKNPQIDPPLDDWDAWQQPIKLYDFIAQPAFGGDLVAVEDDGNELLITIANIPITADIWKSVQMTANKSRQWSEDDLMRKYTHNDEVFHLVVVKIGFPIYTGEDGEEYIKHTSDGGRWGSTPQRRGNCVEAYERWLYPETLDEIIAEELRAVLDEKKKKRKKKKSKKKKAGSESSKETSLHHWFKRKGAKGKKKGWVDCNAPDGKGGYKSCGRGSGEKRKKYPACRPTPGACKERGRGKSWGKKAKKRGKKK